jgi:hypothetical protein
MTNIQPIPQELYNTISNIISIQREHNRNYQKDYYLNNIEKCRLNKRINYYKKFFDLEYINETIRIYGKELAIIQFKIKRLEQQKQILINNPSNNIPTFNLNF